MDVFVYGTLTEPDRAAAILDDWNYVGEATVDGLHRVEGTYPTLAPGGRVDGQVLRTPQVDRLDAYEGVDSGLYVRKSVPRGDGGEPVALYVGDPERLDAPTSWPGEGPFEERVGNYLDAHDVVLYERDDRQD